MNLTTKVLITFTLVIGVALLTASFMIDRSVNTALGATQRLSTPAADRIRRGRRAGLH